MATSDVPGYNPANKDVLALGCWAEADDKKSLLFVEGTESGEVVYCMFDLDDLEHHYRHIMPEADFKKGFSWKSGDAITSDRWTWHDKTPFPWDRLKAAGFKGGTGHALAGNQISAAERTARVLDLKPQRTDPAWVALKGVRKLKKLVTKLAEALAGLPE
jgi:hypothetical protein